MDSVALVVGGLVVGVLVGLTGMGGGALMTPMLVLIFGVNPLAAVSSDLVASLVMKPVGGLVHLRRGTVDKRLVLWLCAGSVPCAFSGVLVARAFGDSDRVNEVIQLALGGALLLAVAGMAARAVVRLREQSRARAAGRTEPAQTSGPVPIRPVLTLVIGAVGGLIVGMTSVGSGSLMIVALLALYPMLTPRGLVGTDLVQSVPLVAAASLAHLLFGDFQFGLTVTLLIGALPGVYIGARLSSAAPSSVIGRAIGLALLVSGLKMLGASDALLIASAVAGLVVCIPVWSLAAPRITAWYRSRLVPERAGRLATESAD